MSELMTVMHKYEINETKSIFIIGDTHSLAFKNKILNYPDYKLNIKTDVLCLDDLKTNNIVINGNLRKEIFDFFRENTLVDTKGTPTQLSEEIYSIRKHYLSRQSFDAPVLMFFCGENDIKDLFRIMQNDSQTNTKLYSSITNLVTNYLNLFQSLKSLFKGGIKISVHEICPPSSNDEEFININGFLVDKSIRAFAYNLFNKTLNEKAPELGINIVNAYSKLADESTGFIKEKYEYDGVHSDDCYVNESLAQLTKVWMMYRIAEQSGRYFQWYKDIYWKPGDTNETNPYKSNINLSSMGISKKFKLFNKDEVAQIVNAIDDYKPHLLYGAMTREYSTLSPEHKLNMTTEVKIGKISKDGLQLIYDKIFNSEYFSEIKSLLGANFSIVNVRPTYSEKHNKEGTGPQRLHWDMCPPALFRALVYLVDVNENDGAFEYIPVGEDEKILKVYGEAGDLFIFDADTIKHRATPPINKPRIALDLMLLAQHEGMPNVVTSIPGTGWPVDPYRFKLSPHAIVQNNTKTWFPNYPKLIINTNVTQVAAE